MMLRNLLTKSHLLKPAQVQNFFVARRPQLVFVQQMNFSDRKGGSWAEYKKDQGKFGQNRSGADALQFERDIKERTERKLNWNIKNRWEQRALDDIVKNADLKQAMFKDFARISQQKLASEIQEFNSVDEIYFFLESMFLEGLDERLISIALDVFIRDAAFFKEDDLENPTFQIFLRELGRNMITFQHPGSYVKVATFLDWFCVEDKFLWVNLEQFVLKKERTFDDQAYLKILQHFGNQNEGSRDFYDFFEFQYDSKMFKDVKTHDLISIVYSFYQVHAGTQFFFSQVEADLNNRLNESVSTQNLLRVLQAFSEIANQFPRLFVQLETLFVKRFDQMGQDEMTCCASGFAISGFGSPFLFRFIEQNMLEQVSEFNTENLKEMTRAFVFSKRGSKLLHQLLMPRLQLILHEFTCRELCYITYGYFKAGYIPKPFAKALEIQISKTLGDDEVALEEVQLITQVFTRSRAGSRDFHKLLESTLLQRMVDLKQNPKILHSIGYELESSGLCSLDTLKILKQEMLQVELEQDVFS